MGLVALGFVALGLAVWGLRALVTTKTGRWGFRLAFAGVIFLGLFAVQAAVEVARTGDVPENFLLFGLGFLSLVVGQVLLAVALRGALRLALLAAVAGGVLGIAIEADPFHDVGLFVFEAAWVAIGITLLRGGERLP